MSFRLQCLAATQGSAKTANADPVANANPANFANAGGLRGSGLADLAKLALAADSQLSVEQPAGEYRSAIIAARDAADLEHWRAALILGRLHLCGNCTRYSFGEDPAGPGTCALHGEALLAFAMPFKCSDFAASATPAAPAYVPDAALARAKAAT